jgi:uncharacterized protein (TIGR03118 family)
MRSRSTLARRIGVALAFAFALGSMPLIAQHGKTGYVQHNLVANGAITADHTDPNLVNAWGVAFNPNGFVWVANNHTGTSTLYDGDGNPQSLVVNIPTPTADNGGSPTGIVYNGSSGFVVTGTSGSGPSRFLFATEDGVIAGWSPSADATHAIMAVDNSVNNAIYKGLALGAGGSGQLLYAADFHNGKVDVFDSTFGPAKLSGSFMDPALPAGFAPFGIQAIGGDIYVTYAMQDADAEDEVAGKGLGYVDLYDANGNLLRRVASRGSLNAPWGVAWAPASFGALGNSLLIGNFGDGRINAFETFRGIPLGGLLDANRKPIQIDGLWGIAFGNGLANQPTNTLFFAAGPDDEANGLYGRIDAQ